MTAGGASRGASWGKALLPRRVRAGVKPLVRQAARATGGLRPLPDFFVVGTKRGGTTSLWNWLLQHPAVLPLVPAAQNLKSSHYFSMHYGRGEAWFRGFFPTGAVRQRAERRLGTRPVAGEASPYYLMDPRIPGRVAALVPGARIVVLLRDPVARAYSHHRERVHEGVEPLDLRDALVAEPARLAGEAERMAADPLYYSRAHDWYSYRARGLYAPQVRAWQAVVPPEQLLVVRSEDLYTAPQATYDTVTGFLGLPPHDLARARRHNYHPADPLPADVREDLAQYYREPNEELYRLLDRDMEW